MTPKEQALQMIEGRINTITKLSIEVIEYIYTAAYNEAVVAAADVCDKNMHDATADEIRGLKK